jgi:hypothetical protein
MSDAVMKDLTQVLGNFHDMATHFLPRLLVMLIIIVIGWGVAALLKIIFRRVLMLVKFNALYENVGATQLFLKADLPPPSEMVGRFVFWVVWVAFIMLGISALGLTPLQEQISKFFSYIPQLFVALLILFFGLLMANFVSRAVLLALVNADVPSARLLSNAARFFILVLTAVMALDQIALAKNVVLTAFAIAFGAVMFGLAIAFGLGGKEVARRILEKQFSEEKGEKEKEDEISHL